ncbi:putative ARAC FAMILY TRANSCRIPTIONAL REGULATORY PROTEIN [Vibrio nigripulchritudo SOn1]|uniref:ARAC FAMILY TRANSCRIPTIONAL REGULATORY PROTEIN n=1 Tax=Vibrio nigripulchritudo SOn1 TaxID=1238450 RepID=A0AAV2VU06_9VIBR|nr:helix-turn-helix domain-containing protein [Vibrio nigripulchritudo]CCO48176.1 putative ARAC FAMILY TRANSCRIPTIONAL REGULATORY PROTEIN [Vibrio nigripulchritudo SOn1]
MRVAILSYPNVALFELACAVELFALPRPEFDDWYECDVVTFEDTELESTAGLMLRAKCVEDLNRYDMLVVPSWLAEGNDMPGVLKASVQSFYESGKRIVSFCSGAFLLAELNVFQGRDATTHWRYADKFRKRFPHLNYIDDVLYIYDGQVGCSAGSASAIDLGLEIIRQDFGYAIANQVARRLVVSAHRLGGQSQFVETPILAVPNQFSEALDWALSHLNENIEVDDLAARASMSRRTFDRKFRSSFNLSPKAWLTQQRLEKAKTLLENKTYSVEKVADLSGFDNAITMRHHFRKQLSISPNQYRQQFADT